MENVKLIFDKRKLETLIRLGVPDSALIELLKTGKATPTGDMLVDDYLKTVLTIKSFSSDWGGKRQKKQDDHHLESQDEKQDDHHLEDKDNDKDNNRIDKDKGVQGEKEKKGVFKKPTVEEVETYCREKGYDWDAGEFVDFYESKGWKIGTTTMADWKAAARNWERRERHSGQYGRKGGAKAPAPAPSEKKFDWEDDPNIVYDPETNTGSVEGVWYYHTWDFAKARMAYLKRKEEGGKNNG